MKTLVELNSTGQFDTDKGTAHSYLEVYDDLFASMQAHADVLEIGVFHGGSLKLWEAYFSSGDIVGLDLVYTVGIESPRISMHACDGTNPVLLDAILGDRQFHIIIDDASHKMEDQKASFLALKDRLVEGGLYVIEDVLHPEDLSRLAELCPDGIQVQVLDRRNVKGRWDDMLVIFAPGPTTKLRDEFSQKAMKQFPAGLDSAPTVQ